MKQRILGKIGLRRGRQVGRSQRTWYNSEKTWFLSSSGLKQESDIMKSAF